MRLKTRIIIVSVLMGIVVGFIDTVLDYIYFYNDEKFLDLMLFAVPA